MSHIARSPEHALTWSSNRLVGKWGIVDVQDSVRAAEILGAEPYSLIDTRRTTIRGGSAGGFTTLSAACFAPRAFAAGTSICGVSDLRKIALETHKFESHYVEGLVGGTPAEVPERYKARSPVFHADNIEMPLLVSIHIGSVLHRPAGVDRMLV